MGGVFGDETQELPEPGQQPIEAAQPEWIVRFCYACGEELPEGYAYCGKCGQPRRSAESLRLAQQALLQEEYDARNTQGQNAQGNPLAVLEISGVDAAIDAMNAAYYQGKKDRIALDGVELLKAIYRPYIYTEAQIKPKSEDGKRVRALGHKLDELQGWLGMIKAYEFFRQKDPAHGDNVADIWSGIGDWAK